jgi:hypothetical protein
MFLKPMLAKRLSLAGRLVLLLPATPVTLPDNLAGCPLGAECCQLRSLTSTMTTKHARHQVAPEYDAAIEVEWSEDRSMRQHIINQTIDRRCVSCVPAHTVSGEALDTCGRQEPDDRWTKVDLPGSVHLIEVHINKDPLSSQLKMILRTTRDVTLWAPPADDGRQHVRVCKGTSQATHGAEYLRVVNHFLHIMPELVRSSKFRVLFHKSTSQFYIMAMSYFDPNRHSLMEDRDMVTGSKHILRVADDDLRDFVAGALPVPTSAGVMFMQDTQGVSTPSDLGQMAQVMARHLVDNTN